MKTELATFANGCFWCTEAIFKRLNGVLSVKSGYTGGTGDIPSYEEVSSGSTGHAEALQISFDPSVISYETLLDVFWHTHNPTTLNRQGNDVGSQYRSAIFYHSPEQQKAATVSLKKIEEEKVYDNPIVTEITQATEFYPAEQYHDNYYDSNTTKPYCSIVITPKITQLLTQYKSLVKEDYT